MIKVGDKFIFEEDEWTVIDVTGCDDTLIARTKDGEDNVFFQSTVYKLWYEQQKQRADRAEKRWSELKDKTIETYVGLRKMKSILAQHIGSILCVMDELEGKENVFETVQQLEEDGE